MSFKDSLEAFAIAQGLKMALGHVERSQMIAETVKQLDRLADDKLGKKSEAFQEDLVVKVLLPMCRELMKENHDRYIQVLESEQHGFLDQSIGGGGQQQKDDRGKSGRGSEVQPKHRS